MAGMIEMVPTETVTERQRANADFIKRLTEACDAVSGIDKKGLNQQQGYKYLRAGDVARAFRHELFTRSIVLLQNEMAPEYLEYQTSKGTRGLDCRLAIEYVLTDGEAEYRLMAHAQAMDTSDKSIYKAKTGALKYFLRGLGLIPDEADPETDSPEADFDRDKYIEQKKAELAPKPAAVPRNKDQQFWREYIKSWSTPDDFNQRINEIISPDLANGIKTLIWRKAQSVGLDFSDDQKVFFDPAVQPSPPEEEPPDEAEPKVPIKVPDPFAEGRRKISPAQVKLLHLIRQKAGVSDEDFHDTVLKALGVSHTADVPANRLDEVLTFLDPDNKYHRPNS